MSDRTFIEIVIREHADNSGIHLYMTGELPRYFNLTHFVDKVQVSHETKDEDGNFVKEVLRTFVGNPEDTSDAS